MSNDHKNGENPWVLTFEGWKPEDQALRETLCALGNGYFATRGAAEEASAGGAHYPATYLAGGYNRLESEVSGRIIENEDLVNWPNWLGLTFRAGGGDWFDVATADVLGYSQSLDLRNGTLERELRFRYHGDREFHLVSRRLVSMANPHLAAIDWSLTPLNWSAPIEIRSTLDGTVINGGVARYRQLNSRHLKPGETGRVGEDGVFLEATTTQARQRMVQAARTRLFDGGQPAAAERESRCEEGFAEQRLTFEASREKPLRVEKVVSIYTSRDRAISEPCLAACDAINRAAPFDSILADHSRAWEEIWRRADLELTGTDTWSQRVLRLHIFHLLQTTSPNSIDLDIGVPARGWHGEAYRGHIFWDEIYIFPFLHLRFPELSRSLLLYRYRRLDSARRLARAAGFEGAMFPWQSGSDGREESQTIHLNPKSGRWVTDDTFRQRHINAAVAYNLWKYFEATGDLEFLSSFGAEMLLEIARFWASIAVYNAGRDRYEIRGVVGPDEFHTAYPERDEAGLDNNAYTNVMAAWTLACAGRAIEILHEERRTELTRKLAVDDEELLRWDEISRKMFLPFHDGGVLSQFEGYGELEEFDWDRYRKQHGDIHRLDRILEAEGDNPNRYKASKQADALMLFYLFTAEELAELFGRLGYPFDPDFIPRTIQYYIARTSHGSTLSHMVHAWVLARSDREEAWRLFRNALESDVTDVQGGTTQEGIHLGAMAGTVDLVQRCYTGLAIQGDVLWLNPCLPDGLDEIRLRIHYRGHWLHIRATHHTLEVRFDHGWSSPAKIGFRDEVYTFEQGDQMEFEMVGR